MTALLALAAILGADDLATRDVEVEAWGGSVRLRALTAAERDRVGAAILGIEDGVERAAALRRAVLMASLRAPDGATLLADAAHYEALLGKSSAAVDLLFQAALDLNGMSAGAREAAKNA